MYPGSVTDFDRWDGGAGFQRLVAVSNDQMSAGVSLVWRIWETGGDSGGSRGRDHGGPMGHGHPLGADKGSFLSSGPSLGFKTAPNHFKLLFYFLV